MSEIRPTGARPVLARIFLSPEEPRLRAGWRLLIQTILMFVLLLILGAVIGILAALLGQTQGPAVLMWNTLVEVLAFTSSIYIARRWLDKRSFASLGLELNGRTLIDIVAGIAITFLQMGFIYVVMHALGWITFNGFAWKFDPVSTVIAGLVAFFIGFILVGWSEELLSRGYHLQTIASGINLFWGVIISSAIFGVLHLGNPGVDRATALRVAIGIFLAGVYLAYGYLRTKQLWLSIGLHIGWNFFEGVVFGFPVSGLDTYKLARIDVHGPQVWTGGAFGPEAGLIVLPALALGAVLIYLYTLRRAR